MPTVMQIGVGIWAIGSVLLMLFVWSEVDIRFRSWSE